MLCAFPFIFSTSNFMGPEEFFGVGEFLFFMRLAIKSLCCLLGLPPKILNFYYKGSCFKLLKLKVSSSSTDKGEYTYIFQSDKASSHNNLPPVISGVGNESPY